MGDLPFGKVLKMARVKAGVTQSELTGLLKEKGIRLTLYQVSSYETGKKMPEGVILRELEAFIKEHGDEGSHYSLKYEQCAESLYMAYLVRAYGDGSMQEDVYTKKERAQRAFRHAIKTNLTAELIIRAIRRPQR